MADTTSVYYPYERIYSFTTLPDGEKLIKQIVDYLLDLPDAYYTPTDNNLNPRVRLMKYLYYDDALPLTKTLPTVAEKRSIVYNPEYPDKPTDKEKGYRIFPQALVTQSQTDGQTILRISFGRVTARNPFRSEISIRFACLSSTMIESNTRSTALSRTFAMVQCLIEALNGVNIAGVGTLYMDGRQLTECGIQPINDESSNVGYLLTMGMSIVGGEGAEGF